MQSVLRVFGPLLLVIGHHGVSLQNRNRATTTCSNIFIHKIVRSFTFNRIRRIRTQASDN